VIFKKKREERGACLGNLSLWAGQNFVQKATHASLRKKKKGAQSKNEKLSSGYNKDTTIYFNAI
jgi:hypothetical protein